MGTEQCIADHKETICGFTIQVKKPSDRYLDEFLRLKCARDMIGFKLFPNIKEITESFGIYNAVRTHLRELKLNDPNINLISVGDGRTPRTAATFAFRSAWQCWSIDPLLDRINNYHWNGIHRLITIQSNIEDIGREVFGKYIGILVHCHSHAKLSTSLSVLQNNFNIEAAISMPCCVPDDIGVPTHSYADWDVHSPKRTINIYRF